MYKCPLNHDSETADYCSVCGGELSAAPAASTIAESDAAGDAGVSAGRSCPDCATRSESPTQVFCEVCGHNFQTGSSGVPPVKLAPAQGPAAAVTTRASDPAPVPIRWSVTLRVDPSLYGVVNPEAPAGQPPQVFNVFEAESLIGRHAPGVRAHVPVYNDPGVSRRHAMLLQGPDGGLSVRDLGSANGTQLNGVDLVPGVAAPLADGDSIALGAWTRIVVSAVKSVPAGP